MTQSQQPIVSGGKDNFRKLAEFLPHMLWTCRADGTCDYLSPQWVAYTGIPEAEQLGFRWLEQIHPDDVDATKNSWGIAAASVGNFDTEFRVRRFDGAYRWFKTRAVPQLDTTGRVIKWFGSNTDIQDLRDAQEASARTNKELEARVSVRTAELEASNKRLEATTAQLKAAQRITEVGSWEFDIASEVVTWSDELFRIFKLDPRQPPPDFRGQEVLFDEESWARLMAAVSHAVATGVGYQLRLMIRRTDGEARVTVARAEALRNAQGNVERLVGTFQDSTEQERAATQLRQLSERLQLATSAAKMGVWDWDIQSNTLVWDDTMHRLYETGQAQFSGLYEAWRQALHPDDRANAEAALLAAVTGPGDFNSTFRILFADGRVKYLRAAAKLHRDGTGQALRMVGVNWDVSAQRIAEAALVQSEALQEAILASAGLAIIATDCEGLITVFNRAAEELLGYGADEVVGKVGPGMFHDAAEVEARWLVLESELNVHIETPFDVFVIKSVFENGDTNEWTYLRKDGSRVPVLLTVSSVRDKKRDIIGYVGAAVDLALHKQHESQLLELNRKLSERSKQAEAANIAKSNFVANVSHEIRTPLGVISGMAYLLGKSALTDDQRSLLLTVDRSAKTLLRMINDILDLSKIEANQQTIDSRPFSVAPLLDEVAGLMAGYAVGKQLELVMHIAQDVPEFLVGDSGRVIQILMNLISNAIKFTEQGTVRFELTRIRDVEEKVWLRFSVYDTGSGIDKSLFPRLFTRFSRADESRTRRVGGTGLGLAIVKQLAILMGGCVGVDSVVEKGSHFWCEIPFGLGPAREVAPVPFTLLVADAHEGQRSAISASAMRLGWSVESAASLEEVHERLLKRAEMMSPFDALVLDWQIPGMNDSQCLTAVRDALGVETHRGAVVVTARDLMQLQGEANFNFADAILSKPVTPSMLFDAVTRAVTARTGMGPRYVARVEPEGQVPQLTGLRILVVDDSDVNRDIAQRMLALDGAQVETASNGIEAIERLASEVPQFDLVLLDIQMPDLDGIETVRRIRQNSRFAQLPIIALTAGALASEREQALAAGMNDFVTKPFEPKDLIAGIRRYVEQARNERFKGKPLWLQSDKEANWPVIEGIESQKVRARLGGDRGMFLRLLTRLLSELESFLAALVGIDSQPAPLEQVHKLRGMALNLGAQKFAQTLAEAENSIRSGLVARQVNDLRQCQFEARRLRASLVQSLGEVRAPRLPPETSVELAAGSLKTFTGLLRQRDLEALNFFAVISPALERRLPPVDFAHLLKAIDDLDFSVAEKLLANLEN